MEVKKNGSKNEIKKNGTNYLRRHWQMKER